MMASDWQTVLTDALADPPARALEEPVETRAAVALILCPRPEALRVLFIRRAEHPADPWSGHVGFPGGRAEPGDGALVTTAMRETREEIGVDLREAATCLGRLDDVRAVARGATLSMSITPFVFELREAAELRLSGEVAEVRWVPLARLLGPPETTRETETPGGSWPCFRTNGLVIWGLTYRMLSGLLARLDEEARSALVNPARRG